MTKIRPGDRVRIINKGSAYHLAEGTVERVQGEDRPATSTVVVKTAFGAHVIAQHNALILVV